MLERVKKTITSRSKAEWKAWAADRFNSGRSWVQEHGELALILGLALGFAVVFVYELLFVISLLAVLCAGLVWHFAPVERQLPAEPEQPVHEPPAES